MDKEEKADKRLEKKMQKIEKVFIDSDEILSKMEIEAEEGEFTEEVKPEKPPMDLARLNSLIEADRDPHDIEDLALVKDGNIFELDDLKKDFLMVKRNLHKMIRRGQTMMDSMEYMDMEDATATKVMAIAQLSTSISLNLKMLIEIHKDIVDIERARRPDIPGVIHGAVEGDVHQNIIFAGNADELMKHIRGK
jgi:hypothetical protein